MIPTSERCPKCQRRRGISVSNLRGLIAMEIPRSLGLILMAYCRIAPFKAFVVRRKTICRVEFAQLLQAVRFEAQACRLLFDPLMSPTDGFEHLNSGYLFVDVAPVVQSGAA